MSQVIDWTHYSYYGNRIYSLKTEGEFVWIGTDGGIVKININTTQTEYYHYKNLQYEEITAISRDNKGNKWFGTASDGLVKYDNSSFVIFNTTNSDLPSNHITGVSVDSKNNIWVSTFDGIAEYNGTDWKVYKPSNSGLPDHDTRSIGVDKEDIIWIGTTSSGLVRFDGIDNWRIYNSSNSVIPDNFIRAIKIDDADNKYIIPSFGGIVKYDNTSWKYFQMPDSIANIRNIEFDQKGNMWLATWGGVVKVNDAQVTVYNMSNSNLVRDEVNAIVADKNGDIWVGSDFLSANGMYLQKFDGTNWTSYNTNSSHSYITNYPVISIAIDSNNVKWISNVNGVIKYDDKNWVLYNTKNSSFPSEFVNKIVVDKSNNKWFATEKGLVKYDNLNWSVYQIGYYYSVQSIAIDGKNHKWVIATYTVYPAHNNPYWGSILFEFNGTTWINHTQKTNYVIGGDSQKLNSLCLDNDGYLWIATNDGLIKYGYEQNSLTIFNLQNSSLPSNEINDIVIDNSGYKWIVTNNGLVKYKNNIWTIFNTTNSGLPNNIIKTLALDRKDNKWIVTDYGLVKYDGLTWKVYNESNSGLYSNQTLICIAIDKELNKWIGAYGDLILYSGEKSDNEIIPQILEQEFYLYQNYPNPFNPTTTINYSIPKQSFVTIKIFDVLGREITTLVNEEKPIGNYTIEFDGFKLTSGVYFYQIQSGNFLQTKKMLLLK